MKKINLLIGSSLVGLGMIAQTTLAQQLFTNLNFESAAFPPILSFPYSAPAAQALPGWTASPDNIYRNQILPRGPYISVTDISLVGTTWPGAEGNFYISMKSGGDFFPGIARIAQTGYLSPAIKSLRFRLWANLTNVTVSFAGQALPCVIISSNQYYVCAADVSRFAGTTGELSFVVSNPGPLVTLDDIAFSTDQLLPPSATTLAIASAGVAGLRLTFPARLGAVYSVDTSTNLSSWTTVATFPATNSIMEYFDPPPHDPVSQFYRVLGPPPP